MPDLKRYPMIAHSYILELKYLKQEDTETVAERQWQEATDQILEYAQAPIVQKMTEGTRLHLLILQIRGGEMVRVEEVS